MEYLLGNVGAIWNSKTDEGRVIYSGNGMTIECFRLRERTRIYVSDDEARYREGEKRTIYYVVLEGCLEFWLGEEKVTVSEGGCITIMPDENFSIWAMADSSLLAFHNKIEDDVDNTPKELVEAVTKLELKDTYLKGHNYRVGKYSTLMMQIICPEKSNYSFGLAAAYHDVGKVVVPEHILNKEGKLTKEEFDEIKKHPAASYEMLKNHLGNKTANFARWHHEKLDGSGYPDGISGDQIPLESRIMAVADIFDALTTARCYRKSFRFDEALEIMKSDVQNGKIDGEVFAVLQKLIQQGKIVDGVDNQITFDSQQ